MLIAGIFIYTKFDLYINSKTDMILGYAAIDQGLQHVIVIKGDESHIIDICFWYCFESYQQCELHPNEYI